MMSLNPVRCLVTAFLLALPFAAAQQLVPTSLEIANPNPVGAGARALGQANAFIAIADDATAASWNPAGLYQLQQPEISFAIEGIQREDTTHFQITETEQLKLEDVNFFSIVYPYFHRGRNLVFSLNYFKQFRFDREYKVTFSQSVGNFQVDGDYQFEQTGSLAVVTPAFGVNVTPKLHLGVSVNFWHHSLSDSSAFEKREFQSEADVSFSGFPAGTLPATLEVNAFDVESGTSFVLGGMYRLNREWTFGAVFKPEYTLDLNHDREVGEIRNGTFVPIIRSLGTSADLEFPLIVGIGTAWRPSDPLTVSSDVTWTQWSRYRFRGDGQDVNPITSSRDRLDDTLTVRVGSEYLIILEDIIVSLRSGFGYDPTPAIDEVDEYYTVSAGAGIQLLRRLNLDIAYEYRWGRDVNGDALQGFNATQDVSRHRLLASLICYF